jgi:hypothetical protein
MKYGFGMDVGGWMRKIWSRGCCHYARGRLKVYLVNAREALKALLPVQI